MKNKIYVDLSPKEWAQWAIMGDSAAVVPSGTGLAELCDRVEIAIAEFHHCENVAVAKAKRW